MPDAPRPRIGTAVTVRSRSVRRGSGDPLQIRNGFAISKESVIPGCGAGRVAVAGGACRVGRPKRGGRLDEPCLSGASSTPSAVSDKSSLLVRYAGYGRARLRDLGRPGVRPVCGPIPGRA